MRSLRIAFALVALIVAWAADAAAQANIKDWNITVRRQEKLGEKHWLITGAVELEQGDTKLYADEVEVFEDEDSVLARGNVVLTQANNRIAADRAEFNTKTHLGTFHNAYGIATLQPQRRVQQPGLFVPQMTGPQDTDIIFFGETVEKIASQKYKITNGGFSPCVQPTPRWNLSADTIVLNVDHYTWLRQAVFKVKDVPMFYTPILYFPTKEDGRATGFLIPTYSHSTLRGNTIHNAFFWAINRSQDATIVHDWYSKTGQGGGAEYRFNYGGGSDGDMRTYVLDETNPINFQNSREYKVNGFANHLFAPNLRGRANVDYFSSIVTNQTFNTDIYNAASNNRRYGGNLVGAWRTYSMNATYDRTEWFASTTSSRVSGSTPRLTFTRNERPLFGTKLYATVGTDVAHLDNLTKNPDGSEIDQSVGRFDLSPQIRYPFTKWQWFTVNTTASWHETFYTRSLDETTATPIDQSLNREYFLAQANIVGPVVMKIWDSNGKYASRYKHTIEPVFTLQRISSIDEFARIIKNDGIDSVAGGTTNFLYGLNNRFYAKRRVGQTTQAVEIAAIEISQTYYTSKDAAKYDPRYNANLPDFKPTNFSNVSINGRVTPTPLFNTNVHAEIDAPSKELRTLSANTNYNYDQRVQTSVGWSHKFYVDRLDQGDHTQLDHFLNTTTTAHTRDNKYGTTYSLNYDIQHSYLAQQRISGFYNSQCCGLAAEYSVTNYQQTFGQPANRQFFLSFTLAGLGNFSPFNGGLSGVPH